MLDERTLHSIKYATLTRRHFGKRYGLYIRLSDVFGPGSHRGSGDHCGCVILLLAQRCGRRGDQGYLTVTKINERLRNLRYVMEDALLTPQEAKRRHKSEQKSQKVTDKENAAKAKRRRLKVPLRKASKATRPGEFLWCVLKAMLRHRMLIIFA